MNLTKQPWNLAVCQGKKQRVGQVLKSWSASYDPQQSSRNKHAPLTGKSFGHCSIQLASLLDVSSWKRIRKLSTSRRKPNIGVDIPELGCFIFNMGLSEGPVPHSFHFFLSAFAVWNLQKSRFTCSDTPFSTFHGSSSYLFNGYTNMFQDVPCSPISDGTLQFHQTRLAGNSQYPAIYLTFPRTPRTLHFQAPKLPVAAGDRWSFLKSS